MKKVFPDLPDWTFDMDEVSAGVYEVIGQDVLGHYLSVKGIDLDAILEECRVKAKNISNNVV
jgi:hypothetical protein